MVSKFKTWDKNSNGSISKSEFKEMVPRVVNLLHKTPTEFLKTLKPKVQIPRLSTSRAQTFPFPDAVTCLSNLLP